MTMPKAYNPQKGFMYQIFSKYKDNNTYEHCDYAKDRLDKNSLLKEYKMAYGTDFSFRVIQLPKKYWDEYPKSNCSKCNTEIEALGKFSVEDTKYIRYTCNECGTTKDVFCE